MILCGGKGARLRQETEWRPKPMVEVGGKPILWHVMRNFAEHGFREFVICLGYRGEMIREYFANYAALTHDVTIELGATRERWEPRTRDELADCRVTLVDTGQETLTGGRVTRVAPYLTDERFLVSYGDAACNLDASALLRFHLAHGAAATVTAVRATSRFGVLELESDHTVREFREKPELNDWISAGYFVFERGVLPELGGDDVMLEQAPMNALAARGELKAYRHEGFWQPMDTYREYELLNALWAAGDPPWLRPEAVGRTLVD